MINEHDLDAMAPGFREGRWGKTMTHTDFIKMLEESLTYCREADDSGSIDSCMAQWQQVVSQWAPILDENGGL